MTTSAIVNLVKRYGSIKYDKLVNILATEQSKEKAAGQVNYHIKAKYLALGGDNDVTLGAKGLKL